MKERRKSSPSSLSNLPLDFLKMMTEVFSSNFKESLAQFSQANAFQFKSDGEVYNDEIVVRMSLIQEGKLAATTVHASCDFDPAASAPTIEDLLAISVDAIGDVFSALFEKKPGADGVPPILSETLSAMDGVPFDWTEVQVSKRKVFMKVDKSNPVLDAAADDWLAKHDPDFEKRKMAEEKEAESLFVVSPTADKKTSGGSNIH